ncbi:MAG: hypothetical protein V2A79_16225 [Planctomycetota bacterium]
MLENGAAASVSNMHFWIALLAAESRQSRREAGGRTPETRGFMPQPAQPRLQAQVQTDFHVR